MSLMSDFEELISNADPEKLLELVFAKIRNLPDHELVAMKYWIPKQRVRLSSVEEVALFKRVDGRINNELDNRFAKRKGSTGPGRPWGGPPRRRGPQPLGFASLSPPRVGGGSRGRGRAREAIGLLDDDGSIVVDDGGAAVMGYGPRMRRTQ